MISDFFVEKSGFQTYCLVGDKKKCTGDVYIIFGFLMNIPPLTLGYYFSLITGGFLFFNASILYVLLWDYVLVGIFIRIMYYFYIDEERELGKRVYDRDYVDFGIRWGVLHSISLTLYAGMFLMFPKTIDLLIILIWFIFLNTDIFPDYLNKIWISDVRSTDGNNYLAPIFSIMQLMSIFFVFFY